MTELEKGPQGRRRGRGARERILGASQRLFRDQGINGTGMDQLCAAAQVSKRTAYQHFAGKDELVAEYLRRFDPDVTGGVFDRTDLTPRERLLAAFEVPATGAQDITPMCPYIAASIEIRDPQHPARQYARDYKKAFAARFAETAREAGAANPEQLGEQLALLLDGASARTRVLNTESFPTAAAIAAVLVDNAIPASSPRQPGDELGTVSTAALSHVEFGAAGAVAAGTRAGAGRCAGSLSEARGGGHASASRTRRHCHVSLYCRTCTTASPSKSHTCAKIASSFFPVFVVPT
jgi:AcrR family transcriptional regulator